MLSASVLASLDVTQDPCENFYDFASAYTSYPFVGVILILGYIDGNWLKQHPIPSDKGTFGNFEALAQQNRRLIQQILSEDSSSVYSTVSHITEAEDPYDTQILKKLRGLYSSCMNEDLLDARGEEPLLHVIRTVRKLYNGKSTMVDLATLEKNSDKEKERIGLTAAIAYLHSRGQPALITHEKYV